MLLKFFLAFSLQKHENSSIFKNSPEMNILFMGCCFSALKFLKFSKTSSYFIFAYYVESRLVIKILWGLFICSITSYHAAMKTSQVLQIFGNICIWFEPLVNRNQISCFISKSISRLHFCIFSNCVFQTATNRCCWLIPY